MKLDRLKSSRPLKNHEEKRLSQYIEYEFTVNLFSSIMLQSENVFCVYCIIQIKVNLGNRIPR